MDGLWLNTYELPYYGKTYLEGKYSGKWTIGNIEKSLGSGMGKILGQDRWNGCRLSI